MKITIPVEDQAHRASSRCTRCHAPVLLATTEREKTMPLDLYRLPAKWVPRSSRFKIYWDSFRATRPDVRHCKDPEAEFVYISHIPVCPAVLRRRDYQRMKGTAPGVAQRAEQHRGRMPWSLRPRRRVAS